MEKIVALTGAKQRHPETVIRSKGRSREKEKEISPEYVLLIKQSIRIDERCLEELKAFETFIEELRRIGTHSNTVGFQNSSPWGTSLPSDAEKIAEEVTYIKALAGIHLVGIEKSCGDICQDLANLAENLDHNIVAIRLYFQQMKIAKMEKLSALGIGMKKTKIPQKEIHKLKIISSCNPVNK